MILDPMAPPSKEYVLVIIKPDAMAKCLAGHVLNRFLLADLELIAMRVITVTQELASAHYQHLKAQPFYQELIDFLQGQFTGCHRVIAMIFAGDDAVQRSRQLAGATNPEQANPRSIRGAFGRISTKGVYENVIHVSSDPKEAEREIKLWFLPEHIDQEIYPVLEKRDGALKKKVWA